MPGPKRRRPTHRSSMFDFSVLEPRQLLSVSLPAGVNLVNNSTFVPITEVDSQLYSNEAVEGWSAVNSDAGQQLNLLKFPHEREFVLNLDSTADHFDQVFQDIATQADVEYVLAFDLRERPVGGEAGEMTNDLEVFWNDQSVGTFRGTHQWQKIVLSVTGQADTTRLEFREVAGGDQDLGDGRGPLIDNVSLVNNRPGSLANGSFQTGEDASSNNLYHQSKVAGWGAMGSYDDRVMQIIQSDQATDGSYLDLDSSKEHLDRLYQDLATESGRKYFLSFDIKGADVADADNELRVRWNDQWAGTFFGRDQWQTYGLLLEADSDLTRLVLRETPNGELGAGDGHGPLLDNIRLVGIDTARELMVVDANGLAEGTDSNALYSEGAGPTLITTSELSVQNRLRDSLTSAVIEFDARLDGSNEFLSVDVGSSQLTSSYDVPTGVLLLSGTGSVAVYSEVLQTLRYDNTADEVTGGNREVSITLHSDDAKSAATVITVNVQSENEAPEISPIGDPLVTLGNDFQLTVNASDPNNDPLTYEISSFGEPVSGNSIQPTISSTGEISWSPQRDGILTVTVTVTDDAGASAFRDFSITVARNADVPNDFEAFSGNRQLSNVTPELRNQLYDQAPEMSIDTEKVYEAIFHTADGDIRVLLNDDEAPITVNNFVNLARDGFYDGLTFHRVISLGPGFIAQGGDPTGFGSGGPGYRFDDEATAMTDFDRRDLLAMANAGADTNGSQFFFTLSPQTHLNGRHAIFGEVIEGSDVVDAINQRDVGSATPAERIYSVSILESRADAAEIFKYMEYVDVAYEMVDSQMGGDLLNPETPYKFPATNWNHRYNINVKANIIGNVRLRIFPGICRHQRK